MEHDITDLFRQSSNDEPALPPDMVAGAIAQGRRIRRRRGLLVVGSVAVALSAAGVLAGVASSPADRPVITPAAMMARAEPACSWGLTEQASGAVVLLTDKVTAGEIKDLDVALHTDPRVRTVRFETRQQAYERYKKLWKHDPKVDDPEFSSGVLRESWRVTFTDAADLAEFAQTYEARAGVQEVIGVTCPGTTE